MIPGLSDSWTASEVGLTFTFHIKQGITFSSGNPLRAEDAAFSLQRAVKINKTPAFILNQFGWTAENVDTMVTADGENVIIKVDTPYALDIEKAKALVVESGVTDTKIILSVRNAADRMDMAQSIQNTFGQIGVTVELKVGEGAEQLEEYRGRLHQATLQSWGPDYPNPNTNSSTFAENPNNTDEAKATGYLAWRNAYDPGELGPLSQAAVLERDPAKRVAMYAELQTKHRETSPFITMFQVAYQTGLRANVKDFYTCGATDSAAYWLIST